MKKALRRRLSLITLLLLLVGASMTLSSCVDSPFGPTITSLTVTPSTIAKSDTGMTDEYFEVTIRTSGFEGEFQSADVFIQIPSGSNRFANGSYSPIEPGDISTIVSDSQSIPTAWFQNLEPGDYSIGASVTTDLEEITQLDLATVTVTDN